MSKVIELNLHPNDRTLRHFGWIALVGFSFVATIAWFEVLVFSFGLGAARLPVVAVAGALAVLCACFSLVFPKGNLPIYLGLSVLTYPIGFVLSYVILGTLFYVVIGPIGVVMRLFGMDPMERRILPEAPTYWVDAPAARPAESYFRQF